MRFTLKSFKEYLASKIEHLKKCKVSYTHTHTQTQYFKLIYFKEEDSSTQITESLDRSASVSRLHSNRVLRTVNTYKSNREFTLTCVYARGHAHSRSNRIEGIELKDNWCCMQRCFSTIKRKRSRSLLSCSKLLLRLFVHK